MHDIHPVPGLSHGTVPVAGPPVPRSPRPGRFRRVAAAVAAGLALGAGGVAVLQLPQHDSHVGSVFTASQNPDDNTAEPPEAPGRSHVGTGEGQEDD